MAVILCILLLATVAYFGITLITAY